MRVPTKYSDLKPKERGALGYSVTVGFVGVIGYFYEPVLTTLMYSTILISLGLVIAPYVLPYHLTWSMGSSMMPSIPLGLTLNIVTDKVDDVQVGDVVSYTSDLGNNKIHHRVIGVNRHGYVVKGDWNERADPENISGDQIRNKSLQYGNQPIYVPVSPLAIVMTVLKLYKRIKGEHKSLIQDNIDTRTTE